MGQEARDIWRDIVPDRWLAAFVPEDLPALEFPAYYNDLDKARAQAFYGRYKRALLTLSRARDADPVAAALVRGTAQAALGRYEQALATYGEPAVADDPAVQTAHAALLGDLGRTDEALGLLERHLRAHPDSIDGHYQLGALFERLGDLSAAQDAYGWFDAPPQRFMDKWLGRLEAPFQSAADVVTIGRAYDRWAALSGAYQGNRQLHDAIFSMFVRAYDAIDRTYWPARVAAAEYLVSHNDSATALVELSAAYEQNPRDPHLLALLANLRIDAFDFRGARQAIDELRAVNPRSPDALLVEARCHLRQKRTDEAIAAARMLLTTQPRHLAALGLLAAAHVVALDDELAAAAFGRVDAIDPDNATAGYEAGTALIANHETARAIPYLRTAVERAPRWAAARNELGLALMQEGDEPAARVALEAAYEIDPFNVKAVNSLRLLDRMAGYQRFQSEHFNFVFDPADAPVVTRCIAPYMEGIYPQVTEAFAFTPPWKITVEIFPDTVSFSVRTAGLPGLESYGASLGRVMTVVAPRVGKTLGPYNFARVLRHEFTHTLNLAATDGRCPRWLTEGLAVWQEDVPYRFEWVPRELYTRALADQLFPIAELGNALLQPKDPHDGEIAYMQGFWIVQYLIETHGHDAILRLLEAFKAGRSEAQALQQVTGEDPGLFQQAFFAWAKARVRDWGYDAPTTGAFDAAVHQGETLIESRHYQQAIEPFAQALTLQPLNPLPHRRLAGIYLKLKRPADVIEHLAAISFLEINDNRYAKTIARLARDARDLERANRFATESIYVDPYDPAAHDLLADVLQAQGQDRQAAAQRELAGLLRDRQPRTLTPSP